MSVIDLLDRGGHADIYKISGGKVLKAYLSRRHGHFLGKIYQLDHDAVTRAHFRAEAHAYRAVQEFPHIATHTPKFFGAADPIDELCCAVNDTTYVRGCGIILEFIPGKAEKLRTLDDAVERPVQRMARLLKEKIGLKDVRDASYFDRGSPENFTLTDFAYFDAEEYEIELSENGGLTQELRDRLEREYAT